MIESRCLLHLDRRRETLRVVPQWVPGGPLFNIFHLSAKCFSALACRPLGPGSIRGYQKTRLGETFHLVFRSSR